MVCKGPSLPVAGLLSVWLAVAACSAGVSPEDIPQIDGAWNYSETNSRENGAVNCTIVGTLTFAQDFETFVGSYIRTVSCSSPNAKPTTTNQAGSIPRGRVLEDGIEFRIGECDYRGTITKRRPDRLTGTALCPPPFSTATTTSTSSGSAGSWLAERLDK